MPSVSSSPRIASAAAGFAASVSLTSSALTAVQEDLPALDAHRTEHSVHPPGVGREQVAHGLLGARFDDVHRVALVLERPAEDDLALVDEPVHERGVRVPAVLLAHP